MRYAEIEFAIAHGFLAKGAEVHRPGGFLQGERSNGVVVELQNGPIADQPYSALVQWPDSDHPEVELLRDLALKDALPPQTWFDRMKAALATHIGRVHLA